MIGSFAFGFVMGFVFFPLMVFGIMVWNEYRGPKGKKNK